MASEPIFVAFEEQKLRALTRNDNFFKKVEEDRETYFKGITFLENHMKTRSFPIQIEVDLVRYISIIFIAEEQGYMDVKWDRLFGLKKDENFRQLVYGRYLYVKTKLPHITDEWDKQIETYYKKREPRIPEGRTQE